MNAIKSVLLCAILSLGLPYSGNCAGLSDDFDFYIKAYAVQTPFPTWDVVEYCAQHGRPGEAQSCVSDQYVFRTGAQLEWDQHTEAVRVECLKAASPWQDYGILWQCGHKREAALLRIRHDQRASESVFQFPHHFRPQVALASRHLHILRSIT